MARAFVDAIWPRGMFMPQMSGLISFSAEGVASANGPISKRTQGRIPADGMLKVDG